MAIIVTDAWIPLRIPVPHPPERLEHYEKARKALLLGMPRAVSALQPQVKRAAVEIAEPPKDVSEHLRQRRNPFYTITEFEIIHVRSDVEVDVEELERLNPTTKIEESFVHACAAIYLQDAIKQVMVLSELAYPSCIDTTEGIVRSEKSGSYLIEPKGSLYELRYHGGAEETIWPVLSPVSLEQVTAWAANTSFLSKPIAATRVERALASYTHVISLTQGRTGDVLFRAMQGLEAFYCEGNGDLRRQLAEKSAVWLGRWTDRSNIVGKLYDLRSKFVHGASPLEYSTEHLDSWSEDRKGMLQFSDAADFAVRLLIATIQRCIANEVFDVQWQHTVQVSNVPTRDAG